MNLKVFNGEESQKKDVAGRLYKGNNRSLQWDIGIIFWVMYGFVKQYAILINMYYKTNIYYQEPMQSISAFFINA